MCFFRKIDVTLVYKILTIDLRMAVDTLATGGILASMIS